MCKNDFVCVFICVCARERAVYENDYSDKEILASVRPLAIDLVLGSIRFDRMGLRPGGISVAQSKYLHRVPFLSDFTRF